MLTGCLAGWQVGSEGGVWGLSTSLVAPTSTRPPCYPHLNSATLLSLVPPCHLGHPAVLSSPTSPRPPCCPHLTSTMLLPPTAIGDGSNALKVFEKRQDEGGGWPMDVAMEPAPPHLGSPPTAATTPAATATTTCVSPAVSWSLVAKHEQAHELDINCVRWNPQVCSSCLPAYLPACPPACLRGRATSAHQPACWPVFWAAWVRST